MTTDDGNLLSKIVYSSNALVQVGDGTPLLVAHVGNTSLASQYQPLTLKNVLHVPKLQHNLLSVRQLCRNNNRTVVFDSFSVCVKDNITGDVLLQAYSSNPVYTIPVHAIPARGVQNRLTENRLTGFSVQKISNLNQNKNCG